MNIEEFTQKFVNELKNLDLYHYIDCGVVLNKYIEDDDPFTRKIMLDCTMNSYRRNPFDEVRFYDKKSVLGIVDNVNELRKAQYYEMPKGYFWLANNLSALPLCNDNQLAPVFFVYALLKEQNFMLWKDEYCDLLTDAKKIIREHGYELPSGTTKHFLPLSDEIYDIFWDDRCNEYNNIDLCDILVKAFQVYVEEYLVVRWRVPESVYQDTEFDYTKISYSFQKDLLDAINNT